MPRNTYRNNKTRNPMACAQMLTERSPIISIGTNSMIDVNSRQLKIEVFPRPDKQIEQDTGIKAATQPEQQLLPGTDVAVKKV
ncbi:cyclic nucleotide-binding protein [Novimethylophilus kurashikiensis]|uniref:Cyclic nucleotide-binding protein n=1 Tax=Novimethylophilus kurashikiensis TaxID=1825523 RepID=A0A2R5FAH1_9PROT|nr:cyclic nucleotide-binding protein [Novimethylophilus kurashikiensis]